MIVRGCGPWALHGGNKILDLSLQKAIDKVM